MRRTDVEKTKEILRLHDELGLSQREIAAATGCSLGTVSGVLSKAKAAGVRWPVEMTAKQLGSVLYPPQEGAGEEKHTEPDLELIHREMQRKGVTLTLLWEEYKTDNPDGLMYTQFCQRYRDFRKQNDVYMRKQYKAGERLEVDWAGMTLEYGNGLKAYFFVAVLPASACLYVEPFRDMENRSWITAHVNAFTYFGGAPRILVPDNCKTAVQKASYYDPVINRTYGEMARHYNMAVIPARPHKPKDKPYAENGVQIAERRIIAKLRNRRFLTFEELRQAAIEALDELNRKPFQKLPGSRFTLFRELEKDVLRPLPASHFEYAEWRIVRAGMDYHVEFDGRYYSVPYQYAGRQLGLRATINSIEILFEHERIASHIRSYTKPMRYTTDEAHMPERHRAMADWTPERFLSWANKFGPATEEYICWLMEQREIPEQAFKTCAGILRLGKDLAAGRMETVCVQAKAQNIFSYKYFKMLLQNLQRQPAPAKPIQHKNLRGSGYYGGEAHA
jgi:transposase